MDVLQLISEWPVVTAVCLVLLFLSLWQLGFSTLRCFRRNRFSWRGRHVFITGGSQGLGKEVALVAARAGAKVTIVARNPQVLQQTRDEIVSSVSQNNSKSNPLLPAVSVCPVSADVTKEEDMERAVKAASETHGPIDILITCAGQALTGHFQRVSTNDYRRSMELNYFGTLHAVRAVAPSMIERREGHIVLVSSGMALTAYSGYSTYAPTKYAVRGLGEALRSEFLPYNIKVYQAFPPNFYSPGYEQENLTKPADTKAIEAGEPVHQPAAVAAALVDGVREGEYTIGCGDFGIDMLIRMTSGMAPRSNTLVDALLSPLLVLVGKIYNWNWDRIVKSTPRQ